MEQSKIKELVSQMTVEEKAAFCVGKDFWHVQGLERLGIPSVMLTDGPHGLRRPAAEIIWDSVPVIRRFAFRPDARRPLRLTRRLPNWWERSWENCARRRMSARFWDPR